MTKDWVLKDGCKIRDIQLGKLSNLTSVKKWIKFETELEKFPEIPEISEKLVFKSWIDLKYLRGFPFST